MPKSGDAEKPRLNRKATKSTKNSPPTDPDASNASSNLREDRIPNPERKNRTEMALCRLLGNQRAELDSVPQITPILKRTVGGIGRVIETLRFSSDASAAKVLEIFDGVNKGERDRVPIEALCLKADVSTAEILGIVIMCAKNLSAQESALKAIVEHPKLVKATIDFGKELPGASKDREMIHQAIGFLPSAKGGSVSVNLFGGMAQLSKPNDGDDDDDAFELAFGSDPKEIEGWSEDRHKLLEAGK